MGKVEGEKHAVLARFAYGARGDAISNAQESG